MGFQDMSPERLLVVQTAGRAASVTARYVDPSVRFWRKVDKNGPVLKEELGSCWVWLAGTGGRAGYGDFWHAGKKVGAHVFAWAEANGAIGGGEMCVCHHCDNRKCVRPSHLFLGTRLDNARDMVAKGRSLTGDRHPSRVYPASRSFGDRNGSRKHPERLRRGDNHPSRLHPERRPRGEASGASKLTQADVVRIRERIANGENNTVIARSYGLHKNTIRQVRLGITWRTQP